MINKADSGGNGSQIYSFRYYLDIYYFGLFFVIPYPDIRHTVKLVAKLCRPDVAQGGAYMFVEFLVERKF